MRQNKILFHANPDARRKRCYPRPTTQSYQESIYYCARIFTWAAINGASNNPNTCRPQELHLDAHHGMTDRQQRAAARRRGDRTLSPFWPAGARAVPRTPSAATPDEERKTHEHGGFTPQRGHCAAIFPRAMRHTTPAPDDADAFHLHLCRQHGAACRRAVTEHHHHLQRWSASSA